MHEARLHTHNCFLTLTYDDDHLPDSFSLNHRDFQLFIKKLREASQRQLGRAVFNASNEQPAAGREPPTITDVHPIQVAYESRTRRHGASPHTPGNFRPIIRYHMCGEYGPTNGRQHFHANIFGLNFADRKTAEKSEAGYQLYKSKKLDEIWGNGRARIGQLTWQTAAYTARYNLKKAGDKNKKVVEILDPDTGEIYKRVPEYMKMSRGQGIGKGWIKNYTSDVYPHGTIIVAGGEVSPPRFYDEYYRTLDPEGYERLKSQRRDAQSKAEPKGLTRSRLDAEEAVTRAKLAFLKRNGDQQ